MEVVSAGCILYGLTLSLLRFLKLLILKGIKVVFELWRFLIKGILFFSKEGILMGCYSTLASLSCYSIDWKDLMGTEKLFSKSLSLLNGQDKTLKIGGWRASVPQLGVLFSRRIETGELLPFFLGLFLCSVPKCLSYSFAFVISPTHILLLQCSKSSVAAKKVLVPPLKKNECQTFLSCCWTIW